MEPTTTTKKQRNNVSYSHQCSYTMLTGMQCPRKTYADVCFLHRKCKPLQKCLAVDCENFTQSKSGYCPCSRKIVKKYSSNKIKEDLLFGNKMSLILAR
jgi:hypothetical protein